MRSTLRKSHFNNKQMGGKVSLSTSFSPSLERRGSTAARIHITHIHSHERARVRTQHSLYIIEFIDEQRVQKENSNKMGTRMGMHIEIENSLDLITETMKMRWLCRCSCSSALFTQIIIMKYN